MTMTNQQIAAVLRRVANDITAASEHMDRDEVMSAHEITTSAMAALAELLDREM